MRINQSLAVVGNFWVDTDGRFVQRADFSFQSYKSAGPTTGTIALQLDDTNGITINRAVIKNQTFYSIGNIAAEADLNVWGELLFQHSSGITETLNGSGYNLCIRNGDTDRNIK